ncbi:acetyl-CoA carboxylase biotin carboxyl carrier protein [Candidatus Bipolaricaulota bacterium]|nr:acetyl-CoA carboxylase biotin carboxyl carrier protein [Candidatus Bipolaricaulota bacterium]
MDMQELKDIIRLLKEEGLTEITVSDGDQRVTVKRLLHAPIQHNHLSSIPKVATQPLPDEMPEREFHLTAPLVGTFYRRPSPEDDPFVAVGAVVQAGDTVCIIEAMKVMNEIKAEAPGTVRQALLDDGAVVEFGQPLFVFEKL